MHLRSPTSLAVIMACALAGSADAQLFTTTGTFTFSVGPSAPVSAPYWSGDHGDIDVHEPTPGEWEVTYHFHDNSPSGPAGGNAFPGTPTVSGPPEWEWEWEAADLTTWVNTGVAGVAVSRPVGSQWNFTGVAAGQPLYVLPTTPTAGLPYLGFSAEEHPFDVSYSLGAVTGGVVSAWGIEGLGTPVPYWSSFSPAATVADNTLTVPAGGHTHVFLGFSQIGDFTAAITAVPEPTTAGLAAAGAAALAGVAAARSRRR